MSSSGLRICDRYSLPVFVRVSSLALVPFQSKSYFYPRVFCHCLRSLLASDFCADSFPCLSPTVN